MSTKQRHPAELRERATRMAVDLGKAPKHIVEPSDASPNSSATAPRRRTIGGRKPWHGPGVTTNESARIAELKREIRELRRPNQILKSASAFFAAEPSRPSQ